jgi:CHAT domain-containing protein
VDPTWEPKFRLLEADILLKQERWDDVIALLTPPASFPSSGDLAIKRNLICSRANHFLNRPLESARELREARQLADSAHSSLIADVLRAEALAARDSGDWDAADEKFRSSLAAARHNGDSLLQAADLVELGFDHLHTDHFDQAVVYSQEAAIIAQSIQADRQMQFALGNAGWAYYSLGDFENALTNFQAAEQHAKKIGMVDWRVQWLQDAGLAEYKLGKFDDAGRYDEEALKAALTLPTADEVDQIVNIQANLSLLRREQGRYDEAKALSDASIAAARESKDVNVVAYATFVNGLVAARLSNEIDAERLFFRAKQMTTDLEIRMDVENALANLYLGKGRTRDAETWYRRSIETFEKKRSSVQSVELRLSSFAYGAAVYQDYAEFLIDAHRPGEALMLLDHSRARTLEEGLGFSDVPLDSRRGGVVDARAVARKLAAPILFYSLAPDKSHLWVITPRVVRLFELPGEKSIRALVADYQRAIQKSGDPLKEAPASGFALYDVLVKPAVATIANASRIYIVPDRVLHGLNFETLLLPTADGAKYWIDDVAVTTTSSIRIHSRSSSVSSTAATRDLLLIGDPVRSVREFEALPNALVEMQRIRQHFLPDDQTVIGRDRAVPSAYAMSDPGRFRYIHFVAHGTASRSSPLDSAVILSPTPENPENFKLYARDVVQMPLRARLVTISACFGSGLRTYIGEGLVGLAWAFLRAGAHNVIGALWEADDAATPLLMDRLYGELQAGAAPDAALRTAKLSLIHSSSVYRKPFYWAAFQLYAGS